MLIAKAQELKYSLRVYQMKQKKSFATSKRPKQKETEWGPREASSKVLVS